jgi:hypothetical protein
MSCFRALSFVINVVSFWMSTLDVCTDSNTWSVCSFTAAATNLKDPWSRALSWLTINDRTQFGNDSRPEPTGVAPPWQSICRALSGNTSASQQASFTKHKLVSGASRYFHKGDSQQQCQTSTGFFSQQQLT